MNITKIATVIILSIINFLAITKMPYLNPGRMEYGDEINLNAERNCSSTTVETSSNTEQAPADQDPDIKSFFYQRTIDHLFVYNNPMVNYKITVSGTIPVEVDQTFPVYVKFPLQAEKFILMVSTLSGSGKVKVSGRGSMNAGSFKVKKINYDSEIDINVQGKTRFLEEEKGFKELVNLALEEKWNGDLNWDIETSDPENDGLRLDMFKRIVPTKMPDSPPTGRTLEYLQLAPEDQTYEHVSSVPGMGTFRWRYTLRYQNIKREVDIIVPDENPPNPDEKSLKYVKGKDNRKTYDAPKPKDYETYEPRLGPPLESIVWEIVSENAPVIVDL